MILICSILSRSNSYPVSARWTRVAWGWRGRTILGMLSTVPTDVLASGDESCPCIFHGALFASSPFTLSRLFSISAPFAWPWLSSGHVSESSWAGVLSSSCPGRSAPSHCSAWPRLLTPKLPREQNLWMDGWVNGWVNGWAGGWMDG